MVLCAHGDTFQAKLYEIIVDIEGFKTYIDNTLVLDKGIFYKHIYYIRVIFYRMRPAVLKASAPKCSFWLK